MNDLIKVKEFILSLKIIRFNCVKSKVNHTYLIKSMNVGNQIAVNTAFTAIPKAA